MGYKLYQRLPRRRISHGRSRPRALQRKTTPRRQGEKKGCRPTAARQYDVFFNIMCARKYDRRTTVVPHIQLQLFSLLLTVAVGEQRYYIIAFERNYNIKVIAII